jgi:hypothetical protein
MVLWVPTILFVILMIGEFGRDKVGQTVFRVSFSGLISSVLIIGAASLVSQGGRLFIFGIVLWILALCALLLGHSTLLVIHF